MRGLCCHWKRRSLRRRGQEKVSIGPIFQVSQIKHFTVPVIAVFTKFDDLMTQIYDIDLDDDVNRRNAEEQVEKKFRKSLYGYSFPPRADVCFEGKCWLNLVCRRVDWMAQRSTIMQVCILPNQVIIRTRWKFSSRRRRPLLMIPISRRCLFQRSKRVGAVYCEKGGGSKVFWLDNTTTTLHRES